MSLTLMIAAYRHARYRYLCAMGHAKVANALYRSKLRG